MSSITVRKGSLYINGPVSTVNLGGSFPPDTHGVYVKVEGDWEDFVELKGSKHHVLLFNGLVVDIYQTDGCYYSGQCPGAWDRFGKHNSLATFNIEMRKKKIVVGESGGLNVVYVGDKHAFGYRDGSPVILDLEGNIVEHIG